MEEARPLDRGAGNPTPVIGATETVIDLAGELRQARLTNAYLRARLSSLEQEHRRLEERSESLESELLRVARELAAATEELTTERAIRRRTEEELREARDGQVLDRADLAAAGWVVERERRVRAETEAARLRKLREQHGTAVASELEHLWRLVARWRQVAQSDPRAAAVPGPSAAEPRGRAPRRRGLFRSPRTVPVPEATPAGLLLARALELAAGEVEAAAAARQLVDLAGGDAQAVRDAIARAERVMWEVSGTPPEGPLTDPEFAVESAGRMPVLAAGASTLLGAALHRMRAT